MSGADLGTEAVVDTDVKLTRPSMWNVIIHNDDYTPFEFVIYILVNLFGKSESKAAKLAMTVHEEGRGIAGTYTYEIAKQKLTEARLEAKNEGHPLKFTLEEVKT